MLSEELQVLNVVLPNQSREGVLISVRENDAEIFRAEEKERKRLLEEDRERRACEIEKSLSRKTREDLEFYKTFPCQNQHFLSVASKKIDTSQLAIERLSLGQKRDLAQMIYDKKSWVERMSLSFFEVIHFV